MRYVKPFDRLAIVFALALSAPWVSAQPSLIEGKDYVALQPAQPVETPNKIEVIEFFAYGCPHCSKFEPKLSAWSGDLPGNVVVRRVPVSFNRFFAAHQRLFYTLEALGKEEALRPKVFDAIHRDRENLVDVEAATAFAVNNGIARETFLAAWNSSGVQIKSKRANQLTASYQIDSVPTLAVNGKYKTSGTPETMLAAADMLLDRMGVRKTGTAKAPIRPETKEVQDASTKRCEVRPGCAIFIPAANACSSTQYVGGTCPNGLLEGVVKVGGAGSFNIFHRRFHQGKRTGPSVLHDRNSANVSSGYQTNVYKPGETKDGASVYAATCRGASAAERANSHPECQAAAQILGVAAFEKEIALMNQSSTVAEAPTAPAQDSGSTWKAIGDIVGAVADYKQAKNGGNGPASQPTQNNPATASSNSAGMSAQEIAACDDEITRVQQESQSWAGNINEVSGRLGEYQKRLFEGRCANHPQAATYLANANSMLSRKNAGDVHNPANDATSCVEVRPGTVGKLSNSNLKIVNKCGYAVDVRWCVTPCNNGYDSLATIKAGTEAPIAEADPGDGAYYAACRAGDGFGFGYAPELSGKRLHICK